MWWDLQCRPAIACKAAQACVHPSALAQLCAGWLQFSLSGLNSLVCSGLLPLSSPQIVASQCSVKWFLSVYTPNAIKDLGSSAYKVQRPALFNFCYERSWSELTFMSSCLRRQKNIMKRLASLSFICNCKRPYYWLVDLIVLVSAWFLHVWRILVTS